MKPFPEYNKEEIMRSRGKDLTEEQKKAIGRRNFRIARLKRQGYTWKQIASKYNLSREYVKSIGHKLGARGNYEDKKATNN